METESSDSPGGCALFPACSQYSNLDQALSKHSIPEKATHSEAPASSLYKYISVTSNT